MQLGVSKRMLAGFAVELSLFAVAAFLARGEPLVLALLVGGLAMATALSIALSHNIARSAREMAAAARGLAEGDVDQRIELRTDDDLGRIADAFREMIDHQREMARVADAMARGDLRAEVEPKSERDVLGLSFKRMRAGLREMVDKLEHQALHDELSGLPNRTLLNDRLGHAIVTARRAGSDVALVLLDLDRFKDVNDTFGHAHGDRLLCAVAERLSGAVRDCDTFARLGGDEFAIVLPGADGDAATLVVERMLAELDLPFEMDGHLVQSAASIGVAVFPEHGEDAETLLRHADVAMYYAKGHGGGLAIYAPDRDGHSPERLTLAGELRAGIARDELELFYQPALKLADDEVGCVEALVRWRHPRHGLMFPDAFIPVAEETGLIDALTDWVLDAALAQSARWRTEGIELGVAVNLSVRSLRDEALPEDVAAALERHGVRPERLVLEITESALMADPERALRVVGRLCELGVSIAIDDFGTGYSSLSHLKRLPVDELKIDRAFVSRMTDDRQDSAIVRSTIELAHELGLRIVAEGVEDAQTLELLGTMGCDQAQGYYLSRPVPAADLTAWLLASPWAPAARARAA